jgi:hypothetical protein
MHKARAFFFVCAGLLGLALLLPHTAGAAWPDNPPLGVPLCTATGDQDSLTSVSDGAGGAIVAWTDRRSGNDDIYAQKISVGGAIQWTANGVALCTAAGDQQSPKIVSDGAGGAIVAWQDYRNGNWDIYARRISSSGTIPWAANGVALCTATGNQLYPIIVMDGAGGAIIAWQDYRSDSYGDIYAQRISASGTVQWTANGVALCTAPLYQQYPTIASDSASGAIVAWEDNRSGGWDIHAQRILANGGVRWAADGVALCSTASNPEYPETVSDGARGAIVAWEDYRTAIDNAGIYAQRIDSTGAVRWPANGAALCSSGSYNPTAVSDGAGGAIVSWWDYRSGTNSDIYAQRILAGGTVQWTVNGVALCTAIGGQVDPRIVSDGMAGAIVVWQDYRNDDGSYTNLDIYAQRISSGGTVLWAADGVAICAATGDQHNPTIVAVGDGGAIVSWQDYRSGTNYDIYAQRVWDGGQVPVLLSLVSADVTADGINLTWLASGSGSDVATVYRSSAGGEWTRIGEVTADGTGYLRYTDPIDATATRLGYRLGIVDAGIESFYGETWVDLPARDAALAFALDPVRPNPTQGSALTVHFSLPSAAPARLELLDVSGRRVVERELGSLGAGQHTLDLGEGQHLASGLYLVRLRQGANTLVTRVTVL